MSRIFRYIGKALIILLIGFLAFSGVSYLANRQALREAEFRERYKIWQQSNPEVEAEIKGYINNVDWGYYIEQFTDGISNPPEEFYEIMMNFDSFFSENEK